MLKHRLIFGIAMILVLVALFYLDERLSELDLTGTPAQAWLGGRSYLPAGLLLAAAALLLIGLATRELCFILRANQIDADAFMIWLSGAIGCLLIYATPHTLNSPLALAIYASVMVGVFVLSLLRHSWGGRTQGAVAVASGTMLAFIYLGMLPGFYLAIRRWHSAWLVAGIILVCKACDIGAYFTGRLVGRHKLVPWLSPGKTWEGLIGGVVTSALIAVALTWLGNATDVVGHWQSHNGGRVFVERHLDLWFAAVAGLVIGAVGQVGDLMASLFKRDAGIKDSGKSIPGFGGVLDVVDSPILVAPVAYWLLQLGEMLAE